MREILEMHVLNKHGYEHERGCGEYKHERGGLEMELAQAYVRPQPLEKLFTPEEGLRMGTVFPCLSRPYMGWRKLPACL